MTRYRHKSLDDDKEEDHGDNDIGDDGHHHRQQHHNKTMALKCCRCVVCAFLVFLMRKDSLVAE